MSWPEVKALFDQALTLEGEDRALFLQRSCVDNPSLKQEVEDLLNSYDETGDFLDRPIASVSSLLDNDLLRPSEQESHIGARIGAYRIEKEIGRGGMGNVYLALRADSEFDKRVAIKLIRNGSENAIAISRFRRERQILARLENAYIARLLDGGTTPYGLPYFVMEYVEGKPITEYCDEHSLTIRDRLSLFMKVCSAVQYAHDRNIIHRDLKPANILVKQDGTPKLLDFGIAKILSGETSGPDLDMTHQTLRMLTPDYASPEQLRGGTPTVKSDIYSLGVVLYELLCGKRPDEAYLSGSTIDTSRTHQTHLSAPLRAVVLRSIHPNPHERYASVEAFTADIRRYLSGSPPIASGEERAEISRSGTKSGAAHAAYLRGRWLWTNAGGDQEKLLQALVCFMEAIEIDPKFARAHAGVADYYLRMGLWGGLPPSESFAAALKSAETAVGLEPTLGDAQASLAFAIWAYHRDEQAAEKHFNLAIVRNPNYASAHHWYGLLNSSRNRPELAIANLERAQKVDPNSVLIAAALGFVYYNARQFGTALSLVLNAARELPQSGIIQEMLTWCYLQTGDVAAALESGQRAVQPGGRTPAALSALAHAEAASGNVAAAIQLRNEIEERARKMYVSSYDRASAALATGQHQEALRFLEQARVDRDWWLCWIEVDPRWDPLRHEPRFKKLLPRREAESPSRFNFLYAAATCAAIIIASCLIWWIAKPRPLPFASVKFTKVTTDGTAESAIISPDGNSVVYTARDASGMAIWRRDLQSGRLMKLADGLNGKLSDLGFTNHGATIQFVTSPLKDPANRTLFTIPAGGGAARRIGQSFQGPVSLSIDGVRAAFYVSDMDEGADELFTLNLNSGARHLLTSYKYPLRFAWNCSPAWSSDSTQIAFAAEERDERGFLIRLYVLDTATGERHMVVSPRWQWVQSIAWTRNNSALAVVGQEHESSFQQIWYVPYPASREAARRIGNDLDEYIGASLDQSGSEIVSVQSQTLANLYIAKENDLSHPMQITPGSGRYFDLAWMPDGRIVYASDATGSADLWVMNPDGTGQRQITFGTGRSYAPAASPDSRTIAFHSNRTGNWQVWRTNIDGMQPKQLSKSAGDGNWPQFSADGKTVLFHRSGPNGVFNLWQVPTEGGAGRQFTAAMTMHPAVDRATGRVAAWYSDRTDTPQWRIGIFAPSGGAPIQVLNPTANARPDTPMRWMPRGDAISSLDYAHSASNIWMMPVDGRPPHPLTSFDSGEIYSFDWSPKGEFVYSRGLTTSDVVLIRDLNPSKSVK